MNIDKEHLMKHSKTFCMFPWMHLYVSPRGKVYPCCTTDTSSTLGDTHKESLEEIWNNDKMKQIRLDMLNDKPVDLCRLCYKMEETTPHTWRQFSREKFGKHFDKTVAKTHSDGTVDDFKLRFIDIRFSNICNFACRTCGAECSSMWAAEENREGKKDFVVLHADDHKGNLLQEVLKQVPNADMIYFAGGEPLITEEHYSILEELIRMRRTDIPLRYNTNGSTISFKDKDLIKLWGKFWHIELSVSIDHYGERAEYIRHGTDWGKVESNLALFRKQSQISVNLATVLSVFNYNTITEFYDYMLKKNLMTTYDMKTYLTLTTNPTHYAATALPNNLKLLGTEKIKTYNETLQFNTLKNYLVEAMSFANREDAWDQNKELFKSTTLERDKARSQDFVKTFPELASMIYE
jgi:radical SAM protein with 4Fe4S-binding SPASM domain